MGLLLLLLLLYPLLATLTVHVSSLSCFTNVCRGDNTSLCLEVCHPGVHSCVKDSIVISFPPAIFVTTMMGCINETCSKPRNGSKFCWYNSKPPSRNCCCNEDYCNEEEEEKTALIKPKFSYRLNPPDTPIPPVPQGELVCANYNCSGNKCDHYYDVCDNAKECSPANSHKCVCQSVYKANRTTNKLDLHSKGCMSLLNNQSYHDSALCLIDVPFNGSLKDQYTCRCNESLCNVNETFSHPTRLASYGVKECEANNCGQNCVVLNNELICACLTGFEMYNASVCLDINECVINNGGCHHLCINTKGRYYCACHPGYSMDEKTSLCFNRTEIFHCSCYTKDCISTRVCRDGTCVAQYEMRNEKLSLYLQTCGPRNKALLSCGTYCVLHEVEGVFGFYECCCDQSDCNNVSRILFSPFLLSSNTMSLVATSEPSVSVSDNHNVEVEFGFWLSFGIAGAMSFMFLLSFTLTGFIIMLCWKMRTNKLNKQNLESTVPMSISEDFNWRDSDLTCHHLIHSGDFVTVHQTHSNLIVSIYLDVTPGPAYWVKERNIYLTHGLKHDNILTFITAEMVNSSSLTSGYWLIFQGTVLGTLHSYLQLHSLSDEVVCKMGHSIASGLSYLHHMVSMYPLRSVTIIAHRDVNSHSIFVKENNTCAIGNFVSAVKFVDGIIDGDGDMQNSNFRYLSPEVLDSSIQLTSACLTRSDVYSFGLVMWELMNCCQITGNHYCPPFHDVVDNEPSLETMKFIVIDQKITPSIPEAFKRRRDFSLLTSYTSDCFDNEPEGRPNIHMMKNVLLSILNGLHQTLPSPSSEPSVQAAADLSQPATVPESTQLFDIPQVPFMSEESRAGYVQTCM